MPTSTTGGSGSRTGSASRASRRRHATPRGDLDQTALQELRLHLLQDGLHGEAHPPGDLGDRDRAALALDDGAVAPLVRIQPLLAEPQTKKRRLHRLAGKTLIFDLELVGIE